MCTIYLAIKAWKEKWLRCQYSQAVICRILFTLLLYCSFYFFVSFVYLNSNWEINLVVLNKSVLPLITGSMLVKKREETDNAQCLSSSKSVGETENISFRCTLYGAKMPRLKKLFLWHPCDIPVKFLWHSCDTHVVSFGRNVCILSADGATFQHSFNICIKSWPKRQSSGSCFAFV